MARECGDIITSPGEIKAGDRLAVVDKALLLDNLPCLIGWVAIEAKHLAGRSQDFANESPRRDHLSGWLTLVVRSGDSNSESADARKVLIPVDIEDIRIRGYDDRKPIAELPQDPMVILDSEG